MDFAELFVGPEKEHLTKLHERVMGISRGHIKPRFHHATRGVYYYHQLVQPPLFHIMPSPPSLKLYLNDEIKNIHSREIAFNIDPYGQYFAEFDLGAIPSGNEISALVNQCLSQLL